MSWSHSPWNSNCLGRIRVNLLWLNYPPWIDPWWITLVWFDRSELELPSLVYKSMFDILFLGCFFSWFFYMVIDYVCSYLWCWELGKPWMIYYVNELCDWRIVILYGVCNKIRKIWCISSISTTWIFPWPTHNSWWWMMISRWPRGSGLPLHLVVGWKRKYVVRNRVLDSQVDTWVIL